MRHKNKSKVFVIRKECGENYRYFFVVRWSLHFSVWNHWPCCPALLQLQTETQIGWEHFQEEQELYQAQRLWFHEVPELRSERDCEARWERQVCQGVLKDRKEPEWSGLAGAHRGHAQEIGNARGSVRVLFWQSRVRLFESDWEKFDGKVSVQASSNRVLRLHSSRQERHDHPRRKGTLQRSGHEFGSLL